MFRSTTFRAARVTAGLAIGLLGATATLAHHGWSGHDASKPRTVTGTIKVSGYEHSHGYVRLAAPEKYLYRCWATNAARISEPVAGQMPARTMTWSSARWSARIRCGCPMIQGWSETARIRPPCRVASR